MGVGGGESLAFVRRLWKMNHRGRRRGGVASRRKTSGRGEKSRRRANNHTFTCRNMADIRADGETSQLWGGKMYETEEKKVSRLQQERLNKSVRLTLL